MATETDTEEIKSRTASKPAPSNAMQAGGHGGDKSMLFEGAHCLKPALAPKERAWYEAIAAGTLHPLAAAVAPRFHGIATRTVVDAAGHTARTVDYLVLEDTTFGMAWFVDPPFPTLFRAMHTNTRSHSHSHCVSPFSSWLAARAWRT